MADGLRLSFTTLSVLPVRPTDRLDRATAGRAMELAPLTGLVLGFLAAGLVRHDDGAQAARREGLFTRLSTPVDVARELQGSVDPTATVFRFLSRATAAVGVTVSVVSGGLATIVVAGVVAAATPLVRRYEPEVAPPRG